MNLKLQKLDARFDAHNLFTHRVQFLYSTSIREDYLQVRLWCWENFGPSCELKLIYWYPKPTPQWCFHAEVNERAYYIYLTEDARTHFALKWL